MTPPKVDRDPQHLHPTLRKRIEPALRDARKAGLNVAVYETLRTTERQSLLKKRGTTKLGGKEGLHTRGLAVDVVFRDKSGKWTWKAPKRDWQKLGAIGKKHGLTWGGDWKKFPDEPHFQLKPRDRTSWKPLFRQPTLGPRRSPLKPR